MNLKIVFYFFLVIPLLASCDYESSLVLENRTTTKIQLSIVGNPIHEYGQISLVDKKNNRYFYELAAESEHPIILLINQSLTVDKILFDSLEIITATNKINLNSPDEIFEAMEEKANCYYTITVE